MWVALYIDCVHGHFDPVGPFDSEMDAVEWIRDNANDARLWVALLATDPIEPYVGKAT